MRRMVGIVAGASAIACAVPAEAAPAKRPLPYYASIGASRARMRIGPARTYPAIWLYRRAGLPVKVVGVFKEWRRVQDPDGAEGWMQAALLRDTRTAIVTGTSPLEMRSDPADGSRLLWRAAPGVVGQIGRCGGGWCRLDVGGRAGFVRSNALWGVEPAEELP